MRFSTRVTVIHRLPAWTFIEIIISIGIILLLTSAVAFMATKYVDQAKQATARTQVETLALALNAYYIDCKAFPTPQQGFAALWEKPAGVDGWNGPYVAKAIPADPWNHPYVLKVPGPNGLPFEVLSLGADGTEGGTGDNADISSAK